VKRAGATALAVAAVLLAAGGQARAAQSLNGEGESWPQPAVQRLLIDGGSTTTPFQPQYVDVGEATGKSDVATGTADFAVASKPLSSADTAAATHAGRTIKYVPYAAGAVAFVVALDVDNDHGAGRIAHINLTVPTLAKIFAHQIVQWNDPEILAENPNEPNLNFLSQPSIFTVPRLDSSSSTAAVISLFLSDPAAKTIWNNYAKVLGAPQNTPLDQWPNDPNFQTKSVTSGSKGVIDTILQLNPATGQRLPSAASHHIGYLAPAWATKFGAPMVTLLSDDGSTKIDPTAQAVGKALAKGVFDPKTNLVTVPFGVTADGAYPATLISYFAVPVKGLRADKAKALSKLLTFSLGSKGQSDVVAAGYVGVTSAMKQGGLAVASAMNASSPVTSRRTGGASSSSSAASGTQVLGNTFGSSPGLPRTGGGSTATLVAGVLMLGAGEVARRRLLRRSR
jgi:phosphate transport system substrate-binding protein